MEESETSRLAAQVEKQPNSTLFAQLGERHRLAGRLDQAALVLERGIELNPGYVPGYIALARVYLDQKALPKARALLEKMQALDPGNIVLRRLLVSAMEPGADADRLWQDIYELYPLDPAARTHAADAVPGAPPFATVAIAELYEAQGLVSDALTIYRRVLEQDPANAELARHIAELEASAEKRPR